jgi:hypothetical protein
LIRILIICRNLLKKHFAEQGLPHIEKLFDQSIYQQL